MKRPSLVWLHDLHEDIVAPLHDLFDLTVEDRLADLETLSLVVRADDPKASLIIADTLVYFEGRYYRIAEIIQQRAKTTTLVELYCEARWMDLGKRKRAGVTSILAKTPLQGLTTILTGTGWTVGSVPANSSLYSIEDIDATALSLVRRWAAITGYEVEFDTVAKTVSLVTAIGDDKGVGFRWGLNLLSVERRYEPPKATRLYAYGANNLTIEGNNPSGLPYVEDYSWYTSQGLTLTEARQLYRKDETWVDERYLIGLNLYEAALVRLAARAQPTISYEMAVADFGDLTSSPADDVAIGDTVTVRDSTFAVALSTRVVRLIRKPNDPQRNRVELDYLQPGLIEAQRSESTRSIDYGTFNVVVDQADAATVTSSAVDWAEMALTLTGIATIVTGGTFKGTASGTGTIRFSLIVDGAAAGPEYDFDFADGDQVEFSWPSFVADLPEGSLIVAFRARVTTGAGTVTIVNAGDARAWLLVRGAVGVGINTSPNQSIAEVLDDVLLDDYSDGFTITLDTSSVDLIRISIEDTETDVALDTFLEAYVLPFTIGDALFGQIEGPGVIPPASL